MSTKSIILDFEGTIFNGIEFIPQFKHFISKVSEANNCKLTIITNNEKLSTVELTQIIKSQISSQNLQNSLNIINPTKLITSNFEQLIHNHEIHSIYTLINDKLFEELSTNFGDSLKLYKPQDHDEISKQIAENIPLKDDVDAILIGINETEFNFCSISLATRYIFEKNAKFFVIGTDHQFPNGPDNFIPGAYALAMPVQHATSQTPIILGKPNIESLNQLNEFRNAIEGSDEIWVIGDTIETDIVLASSLKVKSILVLTGTATIDDLKENQVPQPTFVCKDLEEALTKIFQ